MSSACWSDSEVVVWPGDREGVRLAGVSRARGEKSGGQQGERTVRSVVSRESGLSALWSAGRADCPLGGQHKGSGLQSSLGTGACSDRSQAHSHSQAREAETHSGHGSLCQCRATGHGGQRSQSIVFRADTGQCIISQTCHRSVYRKSDLSQVSVS